MKVRKHVLLRDGDYEAIKRLHPDMSFSQVVRLMVARYVDSHKAEIPAPPPVGVKL